ncbi:MAG: hypothetical protein EBV19_00175 [Flavobacteriia bacterium]|nr:hypothetical protein [Flavobacteriia bacterium]
MKIVFFIAVLLVLSFPTFSQKVISKNIGTAEILYQENGVTITSQLTECNNTERGEIMQFSLGWHHPLLPEEGGRGHRQHQHLRLGRLPERGEWDILGRRCLDWLFAFQWAHGWAGLCNRK